MTVATAIRSTGVDGAPAPSPSGSNSPEQVTKPSSYDLRFLFAPAEEHPTYRPDVRLLFGKFLPALGMRFDLVTVSPKTPQKQPWGGGAAFLRPFSSKLGFALADLGQQFTLLWLSFRGYDGLIVRDKPLLGVIGLLAAKLARIPYIYWMSFPLAEAYLAIARNVDGDTGLKRRVYAWLRGRLMSFALYRLIVPLSDHVFVQSPAMLEYLRCKGLRHQRVSPVPMGVDMDAIPAGTEARATASESSPSAVYLGTLNRLRRRELEAMVDAARLVAERTPGFVLLIIGESEAQNEHGMLERYAEDTGAAHCTRFFGWQPHEASLAIASTAMVGLSPIPRGELFDMGSPTKAIEYMALGLPVVCNDQPDQEQMVRESGAGYSVEMSASAFADAILRLLGNPYEARAMGKAGKAWVAQHREYRMIAAGVAHTLRTRCRPGVTG